MALTWLVVLSGAAVAGFAGGVAWSGWRAARSYAALDAETPADSALIALLEVLPFEAWIADRQGQVVWTSRLFRQNWDVAADPQVALPQSWRREIDALHGRALDGNAADQECVLLRGGVPHPYHVVVSPLRAEGEVIGAVGIAVDFTERVNAEQGRRDSEVRLAEHIRQAPVAVVEWDFSSRIAAWNPAAEFIFGFSPLEAVGQPASLILSQAETATLEQLFATQVRAQHQSARATFHGRSKSGRVIACEWFCAPLHNARGEVTGAVSFIQDVSERIALEAQLQRSEQLQSVARLAAGVAHEFNNLLAPILIEVERIATAAPDNVRVQEHVRTLRGALECAREFTERTQLVAGDVGGPREWTRLSEHLPSIVSKWSRNLDPRIELAYTPRLDLPPLSLSVSALEQIVVGLLANAQDALIQKLNTSGGGGWKPRIEVALDLATQRKESGGEAAYQAIVVTDNGPGLPSEQQARLFEPLFTTKAPGRGRGLGLAIARNLAAAHQGRIEFVSEPGRGARVHVYLPQPALEHSQLPAPAVWIATGAPVAEAGDKRSILLVEDNYLVAEALAGLLRDAGHGVTCMGDGEEAWAALQADPLVCDLIVTDLNMPGMSGKELLQRVKQAGLGQPVLLITGYTDAPEVGELLDLGACAVIKKPVHPAELLSHVASAGSSPGN